VATATPQQHRLSTDERYPHSPRICRTEKLFRYRERLPEQSEINVTDGLKIRRYVFVFSFSQLIDLLIREVMRKKPISPAFLNLKPISYGLPQND
jgi:hypothetical protein